MTTTLTTPSPFSFLTFRISHPRFVLLVVSRYSCGNLLLEQELTDVHGNEQRLTDMPTQGDVNCPSKNWPLEVFLHLVPVQSLRLHYILQTTPRHSRLHQRKAKSKPKLQQFIYLSASITTFFFCSQCPSGNLGYLSANQVLEEAIHADVSMSYIYIYK